MSKTCICALVPKFSVKKKKRIVKCYCSCVGTASQSETASCRRLNPDLFDILYGCTAASTVLGRAQVVHVVARREEEPVGASSRTSVSRTWSLIEL